MTTQNNSTDDQSIFDDDLEMSVDSNPENLSKEEMVRKLIKENLMVCAIDDLEEKILKTTCPILKDLAIEIINEIEGKLGEDKTRNLRIFDELFIKCQSALEPWCELMNHVQGSGKSCDPMKLKSLIDNLPNVIIKICGHCKSRRQQYPRDKLPPLLSDVFRKCCGLAKIFCDLLNSVTIFSKDNAETVKTIISDVGEIARLITYDVRTMAQTWRIFMKLAITHKDILINTVSIRVVTDHLKHLIVSINALYTNIMKSSVEVFEKHAKYADFLLTILDRLHAVFCRNHTPNPEFIADMIPNLINLSANHIMCTGARLKDDEKSLYRARAKIVNVTRAKSIIDYYPLFADFDRLLIDEFDAVKKKNDVKYAIGYQFIVLSTVKTWTSNVFFQIAIDNINYLQEEILVGSLDFIIINNEPRSIYDSTLSVLINFLQEQIDNFPIYEKILLKNLMSESLWPSLIAHDILQRLYKVSTEDLPMIHIQHFMRAYETLKDRDDSLAVVILERLIIDIYELLSNVSKEEILKNCSNPDGLRLILKSGSSDEYSRAKQLALYRKITAVEPVNNLPQIITDLRRLPTVKNWNRMIALLKLIGLLKEKPRRTNTEKLCEVSSFLLNAVEESTGWRRKALLEVLLLLFECAEVDAEDQSFNWSLISVLFSGISHSADLPLDFLIKLCHYLMSNAHRLNSTSEDNIPVLSHLFCFLLEHKSDVVRQEALETYDHIIETCGNDDLVRKVTRIIAQRPKLREIVPAYLKKEILNEMPSIVDYLRALSKSTVELAKAPLHKCRIVDSEHDGTDLDCDDLRARAENICEELLSLSEDKSSLDAIVADKVRNACQTFLRN